MRALKVCARRGCSELTRGRYCDEHERERKRAVARRRYREGRVVDYGPEWTAIRREFILSHPFCVACGAEATDVDHIVPLARGGTHDWNNLQALCHRCHSKKTAALDGGFGNGQGS